MDDEFKNPNLRRAEATALGMSPEELLEVEQNRKDQADAAILGIDVCELKMRRSGATELEIQAKIEQRRREIKDIING